MKTKLIFALLVPCIFFCSCSSQKYLPLPYNVGTSPFGSYIKVYRIKGEEIKGELLEAKADSLKVLIWNYSGPIGIHTIPMNNVSSYKVQFASSGSYWWTVPVFTASSFTHGFLSIITFPINLITTSVIAATSPMPYRYSDKELLPDQLHRFARFPQGIPPGFDPGQLK